MKVKFISAVTRINESVEVDQVEVISEADNFRLQVIWE